MPSSSHGRTADGPPRLLDQVRGLIRARHYSRRTEEAYVSRIRQYILFHRARTPTHVPVVLSVAEVRAVLAQLDGVAWLMVSLLYGAGLRLLECLDCA